jgi:membrane protease YdiL (CAAX protease family)
LSILLTGDQIVILLPPIELWLGAYLIRQVNTQALKATVFVVIALLALIIAVSLYRDLLLKSWSVFTKYFWRHILYAIGGVIVAYTVLFLVRIGLTTLHLGALPTKPDVLSMQTSSVALLASTTAIMAPFTEEIIFRHVLFYQFRQRGWVTGCMFILSAIAFGLVHWNNFHGDIFQMIPYMFVGAWFALIYYWSKDIWQNIVTHLFFNSIQFFAALLMFIVTIIQG